MVAALVIQAGQQLLNPKNIKRLKKCKKAVVAIASDEAMAKLRAFFAKGTGTLAADLRIVANVHSHELFSSVVQVTHEGWLYKLGAISRKWERRFCLLVLPGILFYFETQQAAEAFKQISIQCVGGKQAVEEFAKRAEKLMKGSYRYCQLTDGPMCEFWSKVRWRDFRPDSNYQMSWRMLGETTKTRANMFEIQGFKIKEKTRVVKLSAESEQERQSWMQAPAVVSQHIAQCLQAAESKWAALEKEHEAKDAEQATKNRIGLVAAFKSPYTGGKVTAPDGTVWTYARNKKPDKTSVEKHDTITGSNGVKCTYGSTPNMPHCVEIVQKKSPGFGDAHLAFNHEHQAFVLHIQSSIGEPLFVAPCFQAEATALVQKWGDMFNFTLKLGKIKKKGHEKGGQRVDETHCAGVTIEGSVPPPVVVWCVLHPYFQQSNDEMAANVNY